MLDLLTFEDFLTPGECRALCEELRAAPPEPATVLATNGRRIANNVRRAQVAHPTADSVHTIEGRLERFRSLIGTHYDRELGAIEAPQFLHYRPGDFFVAHQDGNTPLIRDGSLHRKVSVVVFLNSAATPADAGDYRGGELLFHARGDAAGARQTCAARAGSLVAFPSETTHEVLPVEAGERFTIVSWYLAPVAVARD